MHTKSFVGTSKNAVIIQIFPALTIYLLLAYQKFLSRSGLSVQQLFQPIQLNLLGWTPLEKLMNSRRRKNESAYALNMFDMVA